MTEYRQNSSSNKTRLKAWMREHPEAMRLFFDAPDASTARRLLCDLVRQAGIYSQNTSRSDIPIGAAILELRDEGYDPR